MTTQEERELSIELARLEHLRDQFNNWTSVLSRIKEDEQRWLAVAFILFGALAAFVTSTFGGALTFKTPEQGALGLLGTIVVAHAAAYVWTLQALTLRTQYYRSQRNLFLVQYELGTPIPVSWATDDFEQWRKDATAPGDSKYVEMLIVGGMVCATILLATYRFAVVGEAGATLPSPALWVVGVLASAAGFLWPCRSRYTGYGWIDRRMLRRLFDTREAKEAREKAKTPPVPRGS